VHKFKVTQDFSELLQQTFTILAKTCTEQIIYIQYALPGQHHSIPFVAPIGKLYFFTMQWPPRQHLVSQAITEKTHRGYNELRMLTPNGVLSILLHVWQPTFSGLKCKVFQDCASCQATLHPSRHDEVFLT
jgi:hypothetical protein